MKRRLWFLLPFAAQADAQETKETLRFGEANKAKSKIEDLLDSQQRMIEALIRDIHAKPKPLPDQCPVCGKMAEPRKNQYVSDDSGIPLAIRLPGGSEVYRWVTRCSHCNAAFWQDAEVPRG